jgi:hypothetical protein
MILRTFAAAVVLGPSIALAQGGGFQQGDLYLFNSLIPVPGSGNGAIVRIDPLAGTSTLTVDLGTASQANGLLAFDSYRQRLVFQSGIPTVPNPARLYAADAAGNVTDLGVVAGNYDGLAPTGDGRIYMLKPLSATPFVYLDAVNNLATLLDSAGTAPFQLVGSGTQLRTMIYDTTTNALFVGATPSYSCPGGVSGLISVYKLQLSADGSRVVAPAACIQFGVTFSGYAVGMSRLPDGDILAVVDNNTTVLTPRYFRIDPASFTASAYASNNNVGAALTLAGSYCSALGKAIGFYGGGGLVAFADGESGAGTPVPVSGISITAAATSSLTTIAPSTCSGAWLAYGTGKKGAGDFVPRLYGGGCPDIASAFSITIDRAVGGAPGAIFVGLTKSNLAFLGGSLLTFPILLQLNLTLGGTPSSPGAGALSLPVVLGPDPSIAGLSIYLQGVFADAAATHGVSFTQGLEMVIGS